MVAVMIKPSDSLRHTLNYNENKVAEKLAELIQAVNYPKDADKLSFNDKLNRLRRQAELNPRVKKNSVHITLSFDPSEKHSHDVLRSIVERYMEGIGYGNQPYLVYEHCDTGIQHVHILTTNVQANGARIPSNNIGKDKSEKIRLMIEKEYDLIPAQRQKINDEYQLNPVVPGVVTYGKGQTKKEIQKVLVGVLDTYRYSSLSELNALLRQYNVLADRGSENSRIFKNGGLVYRVLKDGKPVGVPIRSSDFYNKPTLKYLQDKFVLNEPLKHLPYGNQGHSSKIKPATRLRNAIDLAFKKNEINSIAQFIRALKKERIHVHVWRNDKRDIYGITYIDHQTKCVFNGRDVGKAYTSNAIQNRMHTPAITLQPVPKQDLRTHYHTETPNLKPLSELFKQTVFAIAAELQSEEYAGTLAYELRENERRKKRKRLRH